MINIIISIDPTTAFLYGIINNIRECDIPINLIEIHPSEKSYEECINNIHGFESNSLILFLGHGQSDRLYGGESNEYEKKPLVKLNEMNVFKDHYLILLACDSADLLKSSFRQAKMINSIGFGALPTEIEELENNKKFSNAGITQETLDSFRNAIVETVSDAIIYCSRENCERDFIRLREYLILLLNRKINDVVLQDKDENLGDLIYQMKYELVQY